jgi:predicted ATPase
VKSHTGIVENDTPDEASAKLVHAISTVVEEEAERDWLRVRLAPLAGLGEEAEAAEREESFAAWRSFLEAIAATDPFVVVIEDLHWADPALLAFIEHLADWASGVPLFVLCTARPELYERDPSWGGGKRNHTSVSLAAVIRGHGAVDRLAPDQAVLPAEMQTALLSRAGGNPLYAEEFIRMLVDRTVLVRSGTTWELASGGNEIPVPDTVQALIAARLDTLSPERKALLHDAAVIGKVFWAGALAEMGGLDAHEVRDGLHELARKELLRPARRPSIEGEAEYAFWHLLIRDVAYGQIPRAARIAKHRAAAAWIERWPGADRGRRGVTSYHYGKALELARTTGADLEDLEAQARRFELLAAERVLRLDSEKARKHFERALTLTRPGDPGRSRILLFGGRLQTTTGWTGVDSDELLLEAVEESRASGTRSATPRRSHGSRVSPGGEARPPGSSSSSRKRSDPRRTTPEPRVLDRPDASGRRARPRGPQRRVAGP